MHFEFSDRAKDFQERLGAFMETHIYPNEQRYHEEITRDRWSPPRVVAELKPRARAAGLWNLFLPEEGGAGLTNLEYAPLCEIMGRSFFAPEVFNCSAPDTGNMEVLARYGTPEQKARWLRPLLAGEIRSCFAMTEPAVASSDATNIEASIVRNGDEYLINGGSGGRQGGRPALQIAIFMGKTDPTAPRHKQQSMILVPMDAPGVKIERMLTCSDTIMPPRPRRVVFEDVRVPIRISCWARGAGSRSLRGGLGPGASITACVASAWLNEHWKRCAGGFKRASLLASQSPNKVLSAPTSQPRA